MKERDITLDLAKGLLIIFVVLGHALQFSFGKEYIISEQFFDNIVFKSIYSFHMPLFMLISGYLFYNSNKKNFGILAKSKLIAIGIPMLSFILICDSYRPVIHIIHKDFVGVFTSYIRSVFCGMTMWFLFSILLNAFIVAVITRVARKKYVQYIIMLLLCIGSMFVPDTILLGVHKFMFPFFCIGYILKENEIALYSCSSNKYLLLSLTILSICAIAWFDKDTYIYTTGFCITKNYEYQLFIDIKRMIIALITSYTFMQYVRLLSNYSANGVVNSILIRLGQISLFIYGFQSFVYGFYFNAFSYLKINISFNYFVPTLYAVCLIVAAVILYRNLNKNKITRMLFLGK